MASIPKLNAEETFTLITRDLDEVLGADNLKALIAKNDRPLRAYWGTAPTSRPHIGYFVALTKIADFLQAGVQVKVLLADIHAFLDNLKAPIELVRHRVDFYQRILISVFKAIGVPTERLTFVVGSSYQLTPEYTMDVYRTAALTTEHDCKKAGAEVVKQVASPLLSSMLYPGLQALDEQYLDVDFQFGGVDQRKIFTYAEALLPKLGYAKRSHLMNPMVPGLKGSKMSSSDHGSKIDFLDPAESVRSKIKSAVCEPKSTPADGNGVLAFAKAVLFPVSRLRAEAAGGEGIAEPFVPADAPKGTLFTIALPEKFGGGVLNFAEYSELERAFVAGEVHPADLKKGVADALVKLLAPVQKAFLGDEEWQKVEKLAYPPPEEPEKKKKAKKINPRHPPKAGVTTAPTDGQAAEVSKEGAEALANGVEKMGVDGK
ncbi:tyrosine tRNA ligase [Jaminaea rosea]|uniref:Tyrosine--tRNA ligase n=1 Tax=Jaminaea rosea TaxID=1569628 RepID=A0A316V486_9BASI|nr:tyrosine tRNA ligase [Jaminaea rosea]PWN31033.1 tyrosine tRNA ligase [Jaminaea rosea]